MAPSSGKRIQLQANFFQRIIFYLLIISVSNNNRIIVFFVFKLDFNRTDKVETRCEVRSLEYCYRAIMLSVGTLDTRLVPSVLSELGETRNLSQGVKKGVVGKNFLRPSSREPGCHFEFVVITCETLVGQQRA